MSSSERDIPMFAGVIELFKNVKSLQLQNQLKHRNKWKYLKGLEYLVFITQFRHSDSHTTLNVDLRKIEDRINTAGIGVEHMTLHTLRHTFATRGIESGIPPK